MAEAFEDHLYALIGELDEKPECLERFRAKGGDAILFADLQTEPEDLEEGLFALMVEFGVPMPSGDAPTRGGLFSAGYWVLRDVTVGELKQSVLLGRWPDDAWSYHRRRWWDHVFTVLSLPVLLLGAIVFLPVILTVAGGAGLFERVFRKAA